jgi:GT2 family glycosyltransferase
MPEPILTVVVCTHERPADLERCLEALARLADPVEVVVVDSASAPPCRGVVERFARRIPHLRYAYEPQPGLSRARNRGLALTGTELIAFVDDDAAVAPDWARRIAAPFADRSVACVGGACVPLFRAPRPAWLSDRLLQLAGITRYGAHPRDVRRRSDYPFGANMCFRADALRAVGVFPEQLGRTGASLLSGEDTAAVDALRAAGFRVRLEPAAVVEHAVAPERCRSGYYWRRLWWQGVTRARSRRARGEGLRLAAAAPARLLLWALRRDRLYLYRLAETAGYTAERLAQTRARL